MSEKSLRFRIGLFVLIALVLLAGLIYLFGSVPNLFRLGKSDHLYVVTFTDATGVGSGTPVRRSGVKIGEVDRIDLDDENGTVRITLRIEPAYQIRKYEQITLSTGILSNDTTLDLLPREEKPGQPLDRSPVDPGTVLQGVRAATVSSLIARASEVVPPAQETLNEMKKSLQRLEKLEPILTDTLKEYQELGKAAREMIPEMRRTVRGVNDAIPEAQKILRNVNETIPEVQKLVRNANNTWPKVDSTVETAELTLVNLNKVIEQLYVFLSSEDQFKSLVEKTRNILTAMENILTVESQKKIKESIDYTHRSLKTFDTVMKDGQETLKKIDKTADQLSDVMVDVKKVSRPLGDRGDRMIKNVDESAERINQTLGDVRELIKVIGQSDGTFNKFLNDPSLYNHLDEIVLMVGKVVPRLDRIMKDLEVFADKLARHPEAIGVRGVVSPSSGLKDVPSQSYYPNQRR